MTVGSIVLAGGRGKRLGGEKHSEVVAGSSVIQRAVERVQSLSNETLVVISRRQSASAFSYPGTTTVLDLFPESGSLGGIYTGLVHASYARNLVVACDMPFLNVDLLRYMVDISPGYDIVMPRLGNQTEPLHAVYSRECIGPMEKLIRAGDLRIARVFDQVRVRYVEERESDRYDPARLSFFNINTIKDLEKARSIAESLGASEGPPNSGGHSTR